VKTTETLIFTGVLVCLGEADRSRSKQIEEEKMCHSVPVWWRVSGFELLYWLPHSVNWPVLLVLAEMAHDGSCQAVNESPGSCSGKKNAGVEPFACIPLSTKNGNQWDSNIVPR
jgi:hypothetical protein